MRQDRRQFLGQTAVAATAALAATTSLPSHQAKGQSTVKPDEIPIIDCHQHLWDLSKFKLPWIKPGTLLGRSYVMDDYRAAIEGTGIKHAVYMEVDVAPDDPHRDRLLHPGA